MMNSIKVVYLISSVFSTYTTFKFMSIFFERSETNKRLEAVSYTLYYLILSIIYFMFNAPLINLTANIIMFFLLTLNYPSTLRFRLNATVLTYVILAIVECFVVLATSLFDLNRLTPNDDLELIIALISTKILSYILALALSNFKMIKGSINVSLLNWFSIIIIPIGTLLTTIMMIYESNDSNMLIIIMSIIIMFLINIFVFYLYDSLMKTYHEKMEKELLQQQNNIYIKQFKLINQSQEDMKMLRHDIKNHINTLYAMVEKNENQGALNYLKGIYDYVNYSNEYAKSGNIDVDSILNYKINVAEKNGIKTNLKLNIPVRLNIHAFDLSVVLGNLLDNAIDATLKQNDIRVINVSMEYERNIIYINISNKYNGKISYDNGKLKTSNKDTENHGLGLSSVRKSISKYNGVLDIYQANNMFYADVLIYNQQTQDKNQI